MPSGVGKIAPPVLDRANLEQSVRWVAYYLPPIDQEHEHLEKYPSVGVYEDPIPWESARETFFVHDPIASDAWLNLIRALRYGYLVASARYCHVHDRGGYYEPIPGFESSRWRPPKESEVPAELWSLDAVRSDWSIPCYWDPDFQYTAIHIPTSNLMQTFPRPGEESMPPTVPKPAHRYRTGPLEVLETIRAEIEAQGDWETRPVKQDAVKARAMELGLTATKAEAVARVLVAKG